MAAGTPPKEMIMNWTLWIRKAHRWLSLAFTAAVIGNFVALAQGYRATWVGILALIPLALLLASGLYLFALPYVARFRRPAVGSRDVGDGRAVHVR
jgi:hypothetical protein